MSNARIQFSLASEDVWNAYNPRLKEGEIVTVLKDNKKVKLVQGKVGGSTYSESTVIWDEDLAETTMSRAEAAAVTATEQATAANDSASAAADSQSAAATSAMNAKASATAAKTSETNTKASEIAAKNSATSAASSASTASTQAGKAADSAIAAAGSATQAGTFATTATDKAIAADKSATAAAASAVTASDKASEAATSATSAAGAAEKAQAAKDDALNSQKLIEKYKALWFDSIAAMKAEKSLKPGAVACTLGYYSPNDGGGGTYIIRAKADGDVDDGGSVHELANGCVAELVVENGTVNVKQFGAKDGDISEIINKILAQLSINVVLFPIGTYLIANTINVDKGILLKGEDKIQTILNVNADVGFNVTTNYVTPFEIQNMKFIGTDTNTLLIADRKKWGACFKLRDFYLNGFKKAYIAKSAYNTLIENGTIISDAIAEYTTFDEPASNTNFCNDNTIRNVYWQGTKQGYIFYLNNVRSLKIKNCTFEHKEYIFEFKDTSNINMITLEGCWIEDIKYLCLKDDGLRKITGTNNKFTLFTAFTMESDINRLSFDDNIYVIGNVSNVEGNVLQALFNDTKSVSLLSRRILTATGDYALLDFSTKQLKSFLPINTVMNRVDGSDEYTYNIENTLSNETCAAIVEIICLVVFSDYSSAIYKGEILRKSYNSYNIIKWEKVKVLSTGEQSVVNKAAVTLSAKNNEYSITSDVTVARFTVATSVNVLGSTIF